MLSISAWRGCGNPKGGNESEISHPLVRPGYLRLHWGTRRPSRWGLCASDHIPGGRAGHIAGRASAPTRAVAHGSSSPVDPVPRPDREADHQEWPRNGYTCGQVYGLGIADACHRRDPRPGEPAGDSSRHRGVPRRDQDCRLRAVELPGPLLKRRARPLTRLGFAAGHGAKPQKSRCAPSLYACEFLRLIAINSCNTVSFFTLASPSRALISKRDFEDGKALADGLFAFADLHDKRVRDHLARISGDNQAALPDSSS